MSRNSISFNRPHSSLFTWIPVLLGLSVICAESTAIMGQSHTALWMLNAINAFHPAHPLADTLRYEQMHLVLRKVGHFTGYGILGMLTARAWFTALQPNLTATWSRLRVYAATCGVLSIALVAMLDELHQSFLPGRSATFEDVLIDTFGAIALNLIYFLYLKSERRRLLGERRRFMYTARFARVTLQRLRNRAAAATTPRRGYTRIAA